MRSWTACLLASLALACGSPAAAHARQPPPGAPPGQDAPAPQDARAPQDGRTAQDAGTDRPPVAPDNAPDDAPDDAADDAADEQPADARALLAAFARMPGLEARFEEEKHLALLAAPLRTRGTLYFMPPGHLARVVEGPEGSVVTISPTELRMADADGEQTIDLRSNADVRAFVTSLVCVFTGDEAELERSYALAYDRDAEGWTLTLTPREPPLSEMMRELRLRGSGRAVKELLMREPNGDRTATRILRADAERRFTPEEQARLLGIRPR
jgi:hypothetical protein